ncbi:hypothetical protein ACS0TY_030664 [Phlomoides rotata]
MESGSSSSLGLKKNGKKTDRNRRAWTPIEERVLVDLMKDLVTNGWRSENGFKPRYLQKLEAGMMRMLPGTDIRVVPHITSRITIWKKFHGSLQTMLTSNSGINFTATHMIDYHNDTWARIVKEVFSVLDGIADIDEDEKIDVAHWFGKNANCLEVFMGMTDSGRARYVRRLMSGQLN